MRLPIPGIDPVSLLLDEIETTGDLRFSGTDLESGARVTVVIERKPNDHAPAGSVATLTRGLVLVLTVETLDALQ